MIACLDWSGSGEGASPGKGGSRKAEAGGGKKSGKVAGEAVASKVGQAASASAVGNTSVASSMDAADGPLAPPMFLIPDGAPPLDAHRPALDAASVEEVLARKRASRERRIAEIVAEAQAAGRPSERIVAAIIHDSEQAPYSTNRRQLREIGVECPGPDLRGLAEAEIHAALWRTIYGLAFLGIYLCGTDHLDDRAMLGILCARILEEEIRDVPPSRDMSEFIDLSPCRGLTPCGPDRPDGLEGPFDGGDDDDSDGDPLDPIGVGPRPVVERDALLPRPRRDAM